MNDSDINAMRESNILKALRDGPRLRRDYDEWIERRTLDGHVLLGGLGAFGSGEMWFKEEPRHKEYPGYATCPVDDARPDDAFGLTRIVRPDSDGEFRCPACRTAPLMYAPESERSGWIITRCESSCGWLGPIVWPAPK